MDQLQKWQKSLLPKGEKSAGKAVVEQTLADCKQCAMMANTSTLLTHKCNQSNVFLSKEECQEAATHAIFEGIIKIQ